MLCRIISGVRPPDNIIFTFATEPSGEELKLFLSVLSELNIINDAGLVDMDNYVVKAQYPVVKEKCLQAGLSAQITDAYNLLLFSLCAQQGPSVTVGDLVGLVKDVQTLLREYDWVPKASEAGYELCLRVADDLCRSRQDVFRGSNETCVAVIRAIQNNESTLGDCKAMSAFYSVIALFNGYAVQSNLNEVKFSPQKTDFEGHMRFRVQNSQGAWVLCEALKPQLSVKDYGLNSPQKKIISLIDQAPVELMMSELLHEYWRKYKAIDAENILLNDFNWQRIHHFFPGLESAQWKVHNIKKEIDSLISGIKDIFTKQNSLRQAYLDKYLAEDASLAPVFAAVIIPLGLLFHKEYSLFYKNDAVLDQDMISLVKNSQMLLEAVSRLLEISIETMTWLNKFNIDYNELLVDLKRVQALLGLDCP